MTRRITLWMNIFIFQLFKTPYSSTASREQDDNDSIKQDDNQPIEQDYRDTVNERPGFTWTGFEWVEQDGNERTRTDATNSGDPFGAKDTKVQDENAAQDSWQDVTVDVVEIQEPEMSSVKEIIVTQTGSHDEAVMQDGDTVQEDGDTVQDGDAPQDVDALQGGHADEAVQDVDIAQEDVNEMAEAPIPQPHSIVPCASVQDDGNSEEFHGWGTDEVDLEAAMEDTLERVPHLDPHHELSNMSVEQVSKIKGIQLKKELKARGLATSGNKNVLINRLQAALAKAKPEEFNDAQIQIQAGYYDSDSDTAAALSGDVGVMLERRMRKVKPEVEERRKKIWDLLEANMDVKAICEELGCSETAVYRAQKMQSGGKAAKFKFMRQQISALLNDKTPVQDICRIVDCSREMVYKVGRMKAANQSLDTRYKGGKRTKRTPEFIEGIFSVVCSDPSMKIRQIAKHIKVSEPTTRRAVRKDLCLFPYKHRVTQLVPKKARPVRVSRGNKLKEWRKENPDTVIIWTDEKTWNVDSTKNNQNDRYLSYCIEAVPQKYRTTRPSGVMMLGVAASDGKVMPPIWIDKGAKVDSKVYIALLEKVKAWAEETYGDHTPYVFMQDGAPSHTSEETQAWLAENFREFWTWDMWPPYSPDLGRNSIAQLKVLIEFFNVIFNVLSN